MGFSTITRLPHPDPVTASSPRCAQTSSLVPDTMTFTAWIGQKRHEVNLLLVGGYPQGLIPCQEYTQLNLSNNHFK